MLHSISLPIKQGFMCQQVLQVWLMSFLVLISGCQNDSSKQTSTTVSNQPTQTRFRILDSSITNVNFINQVIDQPSFNILTYRNFYNGGGIAIGDVNNDGLSDLYFTANQLPNRLFINRGNLKFEDVTDQAGVAGTQAWSTGTVMADINGDGFLDIYVCNSGDVSGDGKENELFINNGDGTFSEEAAKYGLDNMGYSTQASFFDYDRDGDLDCYLLNNSFREPGKIELYKSMRDKPDELGGDKLYRNDGKIFTDVTQQAGIYSSEIGFGLGAAIGDINGDYLPDIYVSNDFWERDYLYLNQGDGTFSEELAERISFCSISSMGSDIADINNDGHPEIFSTDMLAADNYRLKAMSAFDPFHLEDMKYRANYHYQIAQNCLHLNDGKGSFSEVGMLSEVAATDWSWGALIFDFENDGYKDIFVSNGISKDIMSMDFRDFLQDNNIVTISTGESETNYQNLISKMPSNPLKNFAFQNNGDLLFSNETSRLGLDQPSFSNGSAYGDLDNDGDMDLVVNNVNMPCFIYENEANTRLNNHYVKVSFKGSKRNPHGIGALVHIEVNGKKQYLQNFNSRGFQSSIEPILLFGMGKDTLVNRLEVVWPDQKKQVLKDIGVDQLLILNYADASKISSNGSSDQDPMYIEVTDQVIMGDIKHDENRYNDFDHENLLLKMLSTESPRLIHGDVNGDNLEDVMMLGADGDDDKLYLQQNDGTFAQKNLPDVHATRSFESTCGAFFDQDGDGDLDLMLGVGGNEYQKGNKYFILRYFENDGAGNFKLDNRDIPQALGNFSCIEPADYDQDGDVDLFLGGRAVPGNYGLTPRSFIFSNQSGKWGEVTPPSLNGLGMVTDASWTDVDGDADLDLIIVGDWMPVTIYINESGTFREQTIPSSSGWWNRIEPADLDEDGDMDFVLGNWGLNSKFKASVTRPLTMYVNDFDGNGKTEFIINWYPPLEDQAYPFATKPDLTLQLPGLKKSILTYEEYARKTYETLFPEEIRASSIAYEVNTLEHAILWNNQGAFSLQTLPLEAQFSPVYAIVADDLDQDGNVDIWLGGNFYGLKPQVGRQDASRGTFLRGNGGQMFEYINPDRSGLYVEGEVRDAWVVPGSSPKMMMVARNNAGMMVFRNKQGPL